MARVFDGMSRVDPTFRDRCLPAWSMLVCALTTVTFADISPEFDRVFRRAREVGDFDFSPVPFKGWWGWRRHARLGIWDASISRTSIEQAHLSCRRRVPELGVQCAGFLPLVRSLVLRWVDFARAREAWCSGVLVARAAPRIQSRQLRVELLKARCCHRLSIHRVARGTAMNR